jgi:MFS family permease
VQLPGALRHSDFRRFTAARLLWALASQMLTIAVGYHVYMISRNPFDLGLIGLSQFLPFIALALPAGHVADSFDRRRVLICCSGLLASSGAALTVVTITNPSSTGPIIALMTLFGAGRAIAQPTSQSLMPNLVPPDDFLSAVAVTTSSWQLATIVGPAVGGLLLLARLSRGGRPEGGPERERISVVSLLSGIRFVRSKPIVLGTISLDMFAVLFGGAFALLPIYATDILAVGPTGLGLLRAAPAFGALAVGLVLGVAPLRSRAGPWLLGSVGVFGVATVVFAVSTSFALSLAALALMGCSDMVSVYIRNLTVQFATPDAIRGRVSAVNGVFIGASNELGEFESGITAAWWGAVTSALVGGVVTVAVAVAWAAFFPVLRRMDRFPTQATSPGTPPAPDGAPGSVAPPPIP